MSRTLGFTGLPQPMPVGLDRVRWKAVYLVTAGWYLSRRGASSSVEGSLGALVGVALYGRLRGLP
jgi:hypothetical protein